MVSSYERQLPAEELSALKEARALLKRHSIGAKAKLEARFTTLEPDDSEFMWEMAIADGPLQADAVTKQHSLQKEIFKKHDFLAKKSTDLRVHFKHLSQETKKARRHVKLRGQYKKLVMKGTAHAATHWQLSTCCTGMQI